MASSPMIGCPSVRIIIQQCLSARLQVQPPTENEDAKWVEVSVIKNHRHPTKAKGTNPPKAAITFHLSSLPSVSVRSQITQGNPVN